MSAFTFVGKLPASRLMLERWRIVQSYAPDLSIQGENPCSESNWLQTALRQMAAGQAMNVGASRAALQFLALRAARQPGAHRLLGEAHLFSTGQEELVRILRQLGVHAQVDAAALVVEGAGWKVHGDTVLLSSARSSQLTSAILFNAWDLPFDLYVSLGGGRVADPQWRMSVQMAQSLGLKIDFWDSDFRVAKQQSPFRKELETETDASCGFALGAVAAVSGQVTLLDFPKSRLQPDAQFASILQTMGVGCAEHGRNLKIDKAKKLNGVAVNLKACPDLLAGLVALCTLAEGPSELVGLMPNHPLLSTLMDWVTRLGRPVETQADGCKIMSATSPLLAGPVVLDCALDPQLAFAAAVWQAASLPVQIENAQVVENTFPDFWDIVQTQ